MRIAAQLPVPVTTEQEEFAVLGDVADGSRAEARSIFRSRVAGSRGVVMREPPDFGRTGSGCANDFAIPRLVNRNYRVRRRILSAISLQRETGS